VDDLVDGLITLMGSADEITGPVNLGNPGEFTMRELADEVVRLVGSARVEYRPLPADDPVRRRPDIAQAKSVLDWTPTIPLRDGLARTVEYFRDMLDR
jgi:UDP-glucuronate decarboxylase